MQEFTVKIQAVSSIARPLLYSIKIVTTQSPLQSSHQGDRNERINSITDSNKTTFDCANYIIVHIEWHWSVHGDIIVHFDEKFHDTRISTTIIFLVLVRGLFFCWKSKRLNLNRFLLWIDFPTTIVFDEIGNSTGFEIEKWNQTADWKNR